MKLINIAGVGYSGSGAVLDLMGEYENCIDICGDDEFVFTYIPDGIDDLSYHLHDGYSRFHSSDIAINRFVKIIECLGKLGWNIKTSNNLKKITYSYINNIVQLQWKGNWIFDLLEVQSSKNNYIKYRLKRKLNSLFKKYIYKSFNILPKRNMYLSIEPDINLTHTKHYLLSIVKSCSTILDDQIVLLNQAIPANNIFHYEKYYDNIKSIVIVRDPRDMYLSLLRVNDANALWFPHQNVKEFIEYYKIIIQGVYKNKTSNTLVVFFEDLIYNYNDTVKKIEEFVGNCGMHTEKYKKFNPQKSIQNTQLYKHFNYYSEDISIIEKELAVYLYHFDESIKVSHDKMF